MGLSFRSLGGGLTVGLELDAIRYPSDGLDGSTSGVFQSGTEFHVGAEYAFLKSTPIVALRLGLWTDSARLEKAIHQAVGFGLAFKRFQIDLGIDHAESVTTVSVSGIVRFR